MCVSDFNTLMNLFSLMHAEAKLYFSIFNIILWVRMLKYIYHNTFKDECVCLAKKKEKG